MHVLWRTLILLNLLGLAFALWLQLQADTPAADAAPAQAPISRIYSEAAPTPIGPYSQAVAVGELVFLSGQIALDPETGKPYTDIRSEATQVMQQLGTMLQAAHTDWSRVVKATIYLTDMRHFAAVNEVYGSYFSPEHYPARETVAVAQLPKGVRVEISLIARVGE